jgi:cell division protein FtsL
MKSINESINKIQPKKQNWSESYSKKVSHLKHQSILGFSTTAILIIILIVFNAYQKSNEKTSRIRVNKLEAQIADLKNKSADIEKKIKNAKGYKRLWDKASDNKKNFSGIDISDINRTFSILSEKYNIISPSINISVPESLKDGIYDRQALEVNLIKCTMSFSSIRDDVAMAFINNFINTLSGYVIITGLDIKKTKESYSNEDLINISTGDVSGSIKSTVNFSWYFLKRKEQISNDNVSE